jgi:hypothetical protein
MEKINLKKLLSLIIISALLTGCGSASTADYTTAVSDDSSSYYDSSSEIGIASSSSSSYTYSQESESENFGDAQDEEESLTLLEEKLVYHCSMEIETLDYETTISSIKDAIKKYNGIIQSEDESDSSYNWYYDDYEKTSGTMSDYIQARIPSDNYENFISELDGVGKVTSKSTSVDNISQKYYDTTSQIEALQIQEQNLLAMLEKCETIEDMITVEDRLSEVRYELNDLQTSKRYMDTDVAYSYVNINVLEVMEYHVGKELTKTNKFTDRLKNTINSTGTGFIAFLENVLFLIIRLFPYLVLIAIICFIFRKKIKFAVEKRKNKKASNAAIQQNDDKKD